MKAERENSKDLPQTRVLYKGRFSTTIDYLIKWTIDEYLFLFIKIITIVHLCGDKNRLCECFFVAFMHIKTDKLLFSMNCTISLSKNCSTTLSIPKSIKLHYSETLKKLERNRKFSS